MGAYIFLHRFVSLTIIVVPIMRHDVTEAQAYPPGLTSQGLPPGLTAQGLRPDADLRMTDNIYLKLLRMKIQKMLNRTMNGTLPAVKPKVPESKPPPVWEERGSRSMLIDSSAAGKKLLRFDLNFKKDEDAEITAVTLWLHVVQGQRKKRKQTRKKKKKGRVIRISVYNNNSNETKAIAELRTIITETKWRRIGLPITLVQGVETNSNNSVLLRIECKGCNRRTKIILPQNSKRSCRKNKRKKKKKRKNKRKRRCRRNRHSPKDKSFYPLLVIEERFRNSERRKRSVNCDPNDLSYRNGTIRSSRCCRLTSYITFSDMNLEDYIVTPTGYEASRCIGRCPRRRRNRNRSQRMRRSQRRNRGQSRRRKTFRRGRCRAVQTSPLTVWFFNNNHQLVEAQLSDLVVQSCDCR